MNNRFLLATLIVVAIIVQACAPTSRPLVESPLERQARQLNLEGDYRQAATLWEQLAQQSPRPAPYLLEAAQAWMRLGEWETALLILNDIEIVNLTLEEQDVYFLLVAENALQLKQYDVAQNALRQLRSDNELKRRHRLRQQRVAEELNRLAQGPGATLLNQLTSAYALNLPNISQWFNDLAWLPTAELERLRMLRIDPIEQAWLDLAIVARSTLMNRQQTGAALMFWWNSHLQAGPDPETAGVLINGFHESFKHPPRIAVLLPLNSSLKAAAEAIREGLLSAWATLPAEQRPQLNFFALDDNPQSAVGALMEAREQGHDWIIGPLRRAAVNAVSQVPGNTIPLLLLNQPQARSIDPNLVGPLADTNPVDPPVIERGYTDGLPIFSFALLPEDEARASARMAREAGHETALLLHSDDSWGERVAFAFRQSFEEQGGRILQQAHFDPGSSNHAVQLRGLLGLNQATMRQRRLQSLLGVPLGFKAVPRNDSDIIFLGARARQARQLRPQFKFFDAGEFPIYATVQVYSGRDDPRNDHDLNDIQFPLAPWMLNRGNPRPSRRQAWQWFGGIENITNARLYALGLDAFRLLPYLSYLKADPSQRISGAHGELSLDENGKVQRHLQSARFRNGMARLPTAPETP